MDLAPFKYCSMFRDFANWPVSVSKTLRETSRRAAGPQKVVDAPSRRSMSWGSSPYVWIDSLLPPSRVEYWVRLIIVQVHSSTFDGSAASLSGRPHQAV